MVSQALMSHWPGGRAESPIAAGSIGPILASQKPSLRNCFHEGTGTGLTTPACMHASAGTRRRQLPYLYMHPMRVAIQGRRWPSASAKKKEPTVVFESRWQKHAAPDGCRKHAFAPLVYGLPPAPIPGTPLSVSSILSAFPDSFLPSYWVPFVAHMLRGCGGTILRMRVPFLLPRAKRGLGRQPPAPRSTVPRPRRPPARRYSFREVRRLPRALKPSACPPARRPPARRTSATPRPRRARPALASHPAAGAAGSGALCAGFLVGGAAAVAPALLTAARLGTSPNRWPDWDRGEKPPNSFGAERVAPRMRKPKPRFVLASL